MEMFSRFFYGGYNATTSILLAVLFNVCLYLIMYAAGSMLLLFVVWGAMLGFPLIGWGLIAAAKGPNTSGFGSFMCWVFGLIQLGLCGWLILGMFL